MVCSFWQVFGLNWRVGGSLDLPKQLWTKSANDEQALDGSTYDRRYPMPHVEDVAPPTGALFLARGGTTQGRRRRGGGRSGRGHIVLSKQEEGIAGGAGVRDAA